MHCQGMARAHVNYARGAVCLEEVLKFPPHPPAPSATRICGRPGQAGLPVYERANFSRTDRRALSVAPMALSFLPPLCKGEGWFRTSPPGPLSTQ